MSALKAALKREIKESCASLCVRVCDCVPQKELEAQQNEGGSPGGHPSLLCVKGGFIQHRQSAGPQIMMTTYNSAARRQSSAAPHEGVCTVKSVLRLYNKSSAHLMDSNK